MKPLSPSLYNMRNKKKFFASMNAVILAVSFLYIMYAFTQTLLTMENRNYIPIYETCAKVANYEQKPIGTNIIDEIKENNSVDKLVPASSSYGIKYSIPGASDRSSAVAIRPADVDYFMKKEDMKLIEGSLPTEGSHEIAINKDIAKNRSLKIGDKVGDSIYKFDSLPGEYKIVGILDSKPLISILSANDEIFPNYKNDQTIFNNNFYVFPKEGKKAAMDNYLTSLPKDSVKVDTESIAIKSVERNTGAIQVLDVIAILSIIVMVVTVGSSKYVQYINRKEELGLLNAIGYNKSHILSKTFQEVLITNVLGFILGTAFGFAVSVFNSITLWEPKGAEGVLFTQKGFVVSIFVPLFTILFSLIPINNLINKLDPIKMIEKN